MVEEHFKMRSFTPDLTGNVGLEKVEEHFKMRSFTPSLKEVDMGLGWKNISK